VHIDADIARTSSSGHFYLNGRHIFKTKRAYQSAPPRRLSYFRFSTHSSIAPAYFLREMTQVGAYCDEFKRSLYQPLTPDRKEIRLLTVKAGTRETQLECMMSTVSLLENLTPAYETMSYCWGDGSVRNTISVNGRRLGTPSSAKHALLCMRGTVQDRTLWIDAICINQQDWSPRAWAFWNGRR
jgi:hypothetical protein